jgi:hypothetical protein
MRTVHVLVVAIGLLVVGVVAVVIWRLAMSPIQPTHLVTAQVIAILPPSDRFYQDRHRIFIRGPQGEGFFDIMASADRCRVGQTVQVRQIGISLHPLPTTCR